MKLLIVSGLSGSGKSIALHALEDLDYYCIDNLPMELLSAFAGQMSSAKSQYHDAAVGVDARNLAATFRISRKLSATSSRRDCNVKYFFWTRMMLRCSSDLVKPGVNIL